ncbi:MAG TPA: M23 family metallopeptidase [Desulfuromonadaceae bacterium]
MIFHRSHLPAVIAFLALLTLPLRAGGDPGVPYRAVQGQALFIPLAGAAGAQGVNMTGPFRTSLLCSDAACYALVAVPMDAKPGRYADRLTYGDAGGSTGVVDIQFNVTSGTFPLERFSLPEAFLTFTKPVLKRVRQEQALLRSALNRRGEPVPLTEPFLLPVKGVVKAPFGARRSINGKPPTRHYGVDLRCASGDPVRATQDGTVALTGDYYLNGRVVVINHGDLLSSSYNHLSAIRVTTGQPVRRGDVIGLCGATGRATGPHLHFGISIGQTPVNPLAFIAATAAPPALPAAEESVVSGQGHQ